MLPSLESFSNANKVTDIKFPFFLHVSSRISFVRKQWCDCFLVTYSNFLVRHCLRRGWPHITFVLLFLLIHSWSYLKFLLLANPLQSLGIHAFVISFLKRNFFDTASISFLRGGGTLEKMARKKMKHAHAS